MGLRAILCDLKGVMLNDEALHRQLINQILLMENLQPLGQDYDYLDLGMDDRHLLATIFKSRGRFLREEYLEKLAAEKARLYREGLETLEQLPVYGDFLPFLAQVAAKNIPLALVTGTAPENVDYILNTLGLADTFVVKVTGESAIASKPQADPYQVALERLNQWDGFSTPLQAGECLAIEDSFTGVWAAKKAMIPVVGVAHTLPFHMLQRQSNWCVDYLTELDLELIHRISDEKLGAA